MGRAGGEDAYVLSIYGRERGGFYGVKRKNLVWYVYINEKKIKIWIFERRRERRLVCRIGGLERYER